VAFATGLSYGNSACLGLKGVERIANDCWHRPAQPKAWQRRSRFFLPAGS
jgi:hypothetical protein